ncbi:hypothetical protein JCM3766R1_003638 [Sporobolomyces carnicolor]
MSFPTTPAQKFRAALASTKSSISLLERLYDKVQATQPNADPLDSLRNTDPSTRQTSLHIAANAGRVDVVEWLLEVGVEKEISRDAAGETLLHVAAAKGFVEILAIYLERFQFVVDWVNSRGMTALHVAAMRGELDAAQVLVENGADVNAPDLHGNSPLHFALSYGKLPVVKMLVELDCETDLKNNQGFSANDFAYSFACADALKVYIRLHHDAQKSARASKSRRPRNPRVDSGASSGRKPSRAGSSSELSVTIPPVSPAFDDLTSPPLQPTASPAYSEMAASPSLSETTGPFPARYGLGVRLSGSLRRNSSDGAGRDSPLPAPVPMRPAPTSPSLISLQPATPTTPNDPGSPRYSQYNTTSPARSPIQDPSTASPPVHDSGVGPPSRPQSQSPLSLQSRSRQSSQQHSPRALDSNTPSYFPSAPATTGSTARTTPSGSPSDARLPPPIPLNLARSSSSELIAAPVSNGPKKLRKKGGGRRDSVAHERPAQPQARPFSVGSVPVGSTVLGGGPGGKKLRSERSMSFGTAMTSSGEIPVTTRSVNGNGITDFRGAGAKGDEGRSRSSTNQSLTSYSSSSGSDMPPPPLAPTFERRPTTSANDDDDDDGRDHYPDMLPLSPPLGKPISPEPSSRVGSPPSLLPHGGSNGSPHSPPPVPYLSPPTIPSVDSVAALTTRSHEPSFVVLGGSSTKTSPNPPSHATFPGPTSQSYSSSDPPPPVIHRHRMSQQGVSPPSSSTTTVVTNSISLGRPPSSSLGSHPARAPSPTPSLSLSSPPPPPQHAHHEVHKLRKSSAPNRIRDRSASEVSKDSQHKAGSGGGGGGGRFARALGFGRKAT